ncbi:MAG TPA: BrnA antitoxin family protein [Rhizomicrobium sp.]
MTASKRKSHTDWAKVDAHVITPEEYEEMPEWTEDQLDRAELAIGGKVIRPANGTLTKPGRPRKLDAKKSVHLRLSPDVLSYFRKTGPGWQTRIDETLRKAAMTSVKKAAKPRR